jgi:hypothetical protein
MATDITYWLSGPCGVHPLWLHNSPARQKKHSAKLVVTTLESNEREGGMEIWSVQKNKFAHIEPYKMPLLTLWEESLRNT